MAKLEASWECTECLKENFIRYSPRSLKNRLYSCFNCGSVHGHFEVEKDDPSWLTCIKYVGIGDKTPAGAIFDKGTKKWVFSDPDTSGNKTRVEYAQKYGYDPKTVFCNVNPNHDVCKDPDDPDHKNASNDLGILRKQATDLGPHVVFK